MRIYTKAGDLAFKTSTFPDGQPHFKLETYERDFTSVNIETAIRNPTELFQVGLVVDVLRQSGYAEVNLDIRYLMGARMDRAIDSQQPFTLASVARFINSLGVSKVRILDCHSDVATRLIRNSVNIRPYAAFDQVWNTVSNAVPVRPDEGAENRTSCYVNGRTFYIRCSKKRDMQTGNLSGFTVDDPSLVRGIECLIVDDICDGGATFVGLAKVLREAGAKKVYLYVTHGIFSKGLPLVGIDRIFTTDSFHNPEDKVDTAGGRQWTYVKEQATVIPISMKEMK